MRSILSVIILGCAVSAHGQRSLGPSAFVSVNNRAKQAEYGPLARGEYRLDHRWRVLTSIGAAIPRITKYDFTSGPNGNLASGIAPNTRYTNRTVHYHFPIELGIAGRIGPSKKELRPHAYWGVISSFYYKRSISESEVTPIMTGAVESGSSNTSSWWYAWSPVAGFRSGQKKGTFFAEARFVLLNELSRRRSGVDHRYMIMLGYLWAWRST